VVKNREENRIVLKMKGYLGYPMGFHQKISTLLHNSPLEVSVNMKLRYDPIVKKLKQLKKMNSKLKVLEIGSGSKGVTRFFRHPVTGVDVEFQEHKDPLLTEIRLPAQKGLPFKNNEFDVVLSVDTVEHIPRKERDAALKEMLRVSNRHILLAYPARWTKWDERVLRKWPKDLDTYQNIKEHYDCGMPDGSEVERVFKNCKIERRYGTAAGLTYAVKLLEKTLLGKILTRSFLKVGMPVFRRINAENRHVYFIEKVQ